MQNIQLGWLFVTSVLAFVKNKTTLNGLVNHIKLGSSVVQGQGGSIYMKLAKTPHGIVTTKFCW